MKLAARLARIKPSPTMAMTARAARLKAEGRDILSMSAGEPDFDTPPHVAEAGIAAIRGGHTRYTDVGGTAEIKDAIIAKFRRDNGLEYGRDQILVSNGAKQTIYTLAMALLDPGDEVLIPAPYWVSYPDIALLAEATPVIVEAGVEQGYKITPGQLEAAITPRSRLLLLNSPCNPTGAAYSRAELVALGEVLAEHPRIIIGTDDIYERIWWGPEPFCSLATACPALYDRIVTINGVSKSHAMTGWRIGYCGGPAPLVKAMATIQGQSTSGPSSISQKAAVAALTGDPSCVEEMNSAFRRRHDVLTAGLNSLPGVSCRPGWGTFYAFANVQGAMRNRGFADDVAFADWLLETQGLAGVPGSGFGAPGHLRLSFACSMATIEEALARLARALDG
jgi:aspartate aminotransferase